MVGLKRPGRQACCRAMQATMMPRGPSNFALAGSIPDWPNILALRKTLPTTRTQCSLVGQKFHVFVPSCLMPLHRTWCWVRS